MLNSVDHAKAEHAAISAATSLMACAIVANPVQAVASGAVLNFVQVVPPDQREKVDLNVLNGPVVNPDGRTDVVNNQGEVDDLLASLGF